jgi:hypothetical protein
MTARWYAKLVRDDVWVRLEGSHVHVGPGETDRVGMSDRRPGRALGLLAVGLELPLIAQVFFVDSNFNWGWLFLLALTGPTVAVAALALSADRRDWIGVGVASLGLGAVVVPLVLVWAIFATLQQG